MQSLVRRQRPPPEAAAPPAAALITDDGRVLLSDRGLTAFPAGILDPSAGRDQWWLAPEVRTIDVSFNALRAIPDGLAALAPTLTVLKLQGNALTALPASLSALTALKQLDVSKNDLTALPDLTALGPALVDLNVGGNGRLTVLPLGLGACVRLERLTACDCAITALPAPLGTLPALGEVDVSGNGLAALPPSLAGAARLHTLRAARNTLTAVALHGCVSLVTLDLRANRLSRPGSVQCGSAVLGEVQLSGNAELRGVPEALQAACSRGERGRPPALTTLSLADTGLADLPEWLRGAVALTALDLRNNDLLALPAWLGFLPSLTHVLVEGNPLRGLKRSLLSTEAGAAGLKAYLRTRCSEEEAVLFAREADLGAERTQHAVAQRGAATPAASAQAALPQPTQQPGAAAAPLPSLHAAAAAAVAAETADAVHRGWRSALRACLEDPAARFVAAPRYFPAPLPRLSLADLSGAEGGMPGSLARVAALVLEGQMGLGGDGLPGPADLFALLPACAGLSLASCGLRVLPPLVTAQGWLRGTPPPPSPLAWRSFCPLTTLDLSRNGLTSAALEGAALPPTLTSLDLSHNALSALPVWLLAPLHGLARLSLAHNSIALPHPSPGPVPRSPEDDALLLPRLASLDLSHNALTRVPSSVLALACLESLDLSANELAALPPHLALLPRLCSLGLSGNPQRALRPDVLSRGAAVVLAALRSRVGEGDEGRFLAAYAREGPAGMNGRAVPPWLHGQWPAVHAAPALAPRPQAPAPAPAAQQWQSEAEARGPPIAARVAAVAAPVVAAPKRERGEVDTADLGAVRARLGELQALLGSGVGGPRAVLARKELHALMAAESRLSFSSQR